MRNSPSCNCCADACVYSPSDGCEYSDTFGSLDAGWLTYNCSLSIVSGELNVAGSAAFQNGTYRVVSLAGSSFFITVEVTLRSVGHGEGLFVSGTDLSVAYAFGIFENTTNYKINLQSTGWSGGGDYGSTPAVGDKLTIQITGNGAGSTTACFFVNETLIYSESNPSPDPTTLTKYGLRVYGFTTAKYDNFTAMTSTCCCADLIPATLAVTISGVNSGTSNITLDAGTCTIECSDLNGDYTFANNSPCQWSVDVSISVTCGGVPHDETFHFFLYFGTSSGTRYLYFLISTGTDFVQYLARTPVTDDCCDLATNVIELSSYLSSSFCTAKLVAASELEITASTCV